jgi:hypothetical protein
MTKPDSVIKQMPNEELMKKYLSEIDRMLYAAESVCTESCFDGRDYADEDCPFQREDCCGDYTYCIKKCIRDLVGDHFHQDDIPSVPLR